MKYALLVMFVWCVSACTKASHYTCICTDKEGNGVSEALVIGKAAKSDAYARCTTFKDTARYECIMQIK